MADAPATTPCCLTHLGLPGRPRSRLTLLPPPADRSNPLAIVEVARSAEVLLLLVPGDEGGMAVDAEGAAALQVLRAMGMPTTLGLVTSSCSSSGTSGTSSHAAAAGSDDMAIDGEPCSPTTTTAATAAAAAGVPLAVNLKARSAAKKRAEKALSAHLATDGLRLMAADTPADLAALLRALGDKPPQLPVWRRQRPSLLVEAAAYTPDPSSSPPPHDASSSSAAAGVLALTGWVREAGLSANQLVTVPGAGDFQILRIEAAEPPAAAAGGGAASTKQRHKAAGVSGEVDMVDVQQSGGSGGRVLAVPDPEQQEQAVRENTMDLMAGEQTWPTDEELADAEAAAAAAAAGGTKQRRRLPAGTSDYQAAWILDEDEAGSSAEEQGGSEEEDMPPVAVSLAGTHQALEPGDAGDLGDLELGEDDPGTDGMMLDEEEDEEGPGSLAAQHAALKARRAAAADDAQFPDEVDTPEGVAARVRFARYRGLKSFRSSPWDPREGLPVEYGRVWAFENLKRTARRAREAQVRGSGGVWRGWGAWRTWHVGDRVCCACSHHPSILYVASRGTPHHPVPRWYPCHPCSAAKPHMLHANSCPL